MTGVIMKALARKTENMPHEKKRAAYRLGRGRYGHTLQYNFMRLKGSGRHHL